MFFGINLKQLFLFPVENPETRKYFYIGAAISLLGFIIPILPYLVMFGYCIQVARQVINNESPRMIPWDDWGKLTSDGVRVFGVRMIFSLPILIVFIPMMIASVSLPFLMENSSDPANDPIFSLIMLVSFACLVILIPLSIPLAVIIPAAEIHVAANNDFSAAFRFREWWSILRANLGGFIAAFGVYYLSTIVLTIIIQILMVTIVLACLLPIIMPAATFYITLIMFAAIAQAYKDGAAKLANPAV